MKVRKSFCTNKVCIIYILLLPINQYRDVYKRQDYNEWKTGHKLLGMTNSATGFGGKVGSGIGGALTGWVLAIGSIYSR